MLGISVMLFGPLSWLGVQRRDDFSNEKAGPLIEAHHGLQRVRRQRVKMKQMFHTRDEARIQLAEAPGLFQVRLEVVFLSIFPT